MNEEHYNYLHSIEHLVPAYVGRNAFNWGNSVLGNGHEIDPVLNHRFDRNYLFQYCKNIHHTNLNCLLAILAWGGMRQSNGRIMIRNLDLVLSQVASLRNKEIKTRSNAFELFNTTRQNGQLNGLGIAFFTKLICFLAPHLNGYIMDQWVSKSVNLLNTGDNIVHISTYGWVTNNNTSETYECFCSFIDTLSLRLTCTGFEAEERLFSSGNGHGLWRQYVINQYN